MASRYNRSLPSRARGTARSFRWLLLVLFLAAAVGAALLWRPTLRSDLQAAAPVIEVFPLRIIDPRLRQPLPGTTRTAGYFTLENLGAEALVLVALESPLLDRIEIHETVETEGRVRMERLEALRLPAGGTVTLQPGGKHLMVFGISDALPAEVEVTLKFLSGKSQKIPFRSYVITES